MIEDLRFVEREVSIEAPEYGVNIVKVIKKKILQAYDGHVWFDVPLVNEQPQEGRK